MGKSLLKSVGVTIAAVILICLAFAGEWAILACVAFVAAMVGIVLLLGLAATGDY